MQKIYLAAFYESKIVSVSDFVVLQQFKHLLLGEGGEKQPKLHFVVAVFCVEERFKLVVGHQRKV